MARRSGRGLPGRCSRRTVSQRTCRRRGEKVGRYRCRANAAGIVACPGGTLFAELSLDAFVRPVSTYTQTNFDTAKAVARHTLEKGSGVTGPGYMGAASPVRESMRCLAISQVTSGPTVSALTASGPMRSRGSRDGIHSREVFRPVAERAGVTLEEMLAGRSGWHAAAPASHPGRARKHSCFHGIRTGWRNDGALVANLTGLILD